MVKIEPIRFERGRPMLLAGVRRHHAFTGAGHTIAEQWRQFHSLGEIPGQCGIAVYGVMCGHDHGGFEYMCAAEVGSLAGLPSEAGRMRIQAQDYAIFLHQGRASTIQTTWESILREWFPYAGYVSAHKPDFEVYDRGPAQCIDGDSIEIWISVTQQSNRPV